MRLGVGRYGNLLARLLTGSAQLEVAADLAPEISPVFVLEGERPEWEFLKNCRLMAGRSQQAATALSISVARIVNPISSGVLTVVESIVVQTAVIESFTIRLNATAVNLATVDIPQARDSRTQLTTTVGATQISHDANAAAATGGSVEDVSVLASSPYHCRCTPVVLHPGSAIEVRSGNQNTLLAVNWRWREREITRYERP